MSAPYDDVAGLVLAAGTSRRLGRPKQLLPYAGSTLLDRTLTQARSVGFGQLVVTLGGAEAEVREIVDLSGTEVVSNPAPTQGCSSSIAAALPTLRPEIAGLVLMLGDQPGLSPATVHRLVMQRGSDPIAVCEYDDGVGHPFWFARSLFGELAQLHGDKGVWKLIESGRHGVRRVAISGPVPLDVDTDEDYQRLVASAAEADEPGEPGEPEHG
jgi:molybdenum cofactor cytidylyltransferase